MAPCTDKDTFNRRFLKTLLGLMRARKTATIHVPEPSLNIGVKIAKTALANDLKKTFENSAAPLQPPVQTI